MSIRTGEGYRANLADGREVWIGRERIADVTQHPAFVGSIAHVAALYDAQHAASSAPPLTYQDPQAGTVGLTFLRPRSVADLKLRRGMMRWWADQSAGMMGRTGDYVGTMMTAWAMQSDFFGEHSRHVLGYYDRCRGKDLFLVHALVDPQMDRGRGRNGQTDGDVLLRVVGETPSGPIVRGVKTIATSAAIADDVVVWPLPVPQSEQERDHAVAFSVPVASPGLRLICRGSFAGACPSADHPLSSRFDEVDAVLVFDDVVVPWDRVFVYRDVQRLKDISGTRMRELTAHQTNIRLHSKLEFVYGVLCHMAESIGLSQAPPIQEMLGEAASGVETVRALVAAAEAEATEDPRTGYLYPALQPLQVGRLLGPKLYPRLIEMIRRLGAGGLMQMPASISDFEGPLGERLASYCGGAGSNPVERAKLLKLAWDMAGTEFGARHVLYETFYSGDPSRLTVAFQGEYPKQNALNRVSAYLGD